MFSRFFHILPIRTARRQGGSMEKFTTGLLLGAVAGALVVTNSYKMRVLVKKGQDEMKTKLDEMMDEKIKALEKMAEQTETSTKQKKSKA